MPKSRNRGVSRKPFAKKIPRCFELEMFSANSIELIWYIASPRKQFLKNLTSTVKPIGILRRNWLIINQSVTGQTSINTSTGVFVGLEFDLKEWYSIRLAGTNTILNETVSLGVLSGCVIEHNNIASTLIKHSVLK